MSEERKPDPYLNARLVEGLLGDALAITGNRAGLEQLRGQIERALAGEDSYPFEEAVYRDASGEAFEVAVKRARRRSEMEEEAKRPKPGKTPEALPWAEAARASMGGGEGDRRGPERPPPPGATPRTPGSS